MRFSAPAQQTREGEAWVVCEAVFTVVARNTPSHRTSPVVHEATLVLRPCEGTVKL